MTGAATTEVRPQAGARTVLNTHFADGHSFIDYAVGWLVASGGPRVLHYVGVCDVQDLVQWRADVSVSPALSPPFFADRDQQATRLAAELRAACASALPGIQRLRLCQGRISLTLCAGPLQTMLAAQSFQADEVHIALDPIAADCAARWDKWAVQLLARRCRRGTVVTFTSRITPSNLEPMKSNCIAQGFEWIATAVDDDTQANFGKVRAIYAPHWILRTTRSAHPMTGHTAPRRCTVVGAGLAGASVAQAMALRGWQVTVLDARDQVAQGASGLPVGLVVPHVSVDDSPRSRLSRVGARLTLHHAQQLLQRGQDWDDAGLLQLDTNAERALAASAPLVEAGWLANGRSYIPTKGWANHCTVTSGLWHHHAGWIKPARLVAAWLAHPGIQVVCQASVARLQRASGVWTLLDAQGAPLAESETVVIANAMEAVGLLRSLDNGQALAPHVLATLQELQALHGTVSHGCMPPATSVGNCTEFPPFAVNGHGSLIVDIPTLQGTQWYAAATYETDAAQLQDTMGQHALNWKRLNELLPDAARALGPQFKDQGPNGWTGTRCVSHDRLPIVGPAHVDGASGLWLSIAMGSRGLSLAALCAELLVARMGLEPLPIEARLAQSLDIHRPRRQRTPALKT